MSKFGASIRIWDVEDEGLFLVFFRDPSIEKCFMDEYTPEKGFGIFKSAGNAYAKDRDMYKVYTNTYVFNATKFTTAENEIIGIHILSCFPIKQSQTLEAAVKRVQVIGLDEEYFCLKGERTPKMYSNGARDLLLVVDNESTVKRESSESGGNTDRQIAFLDEHEAIIKCKKEYEEEHLFSVAYASFEDSLQNKQDGVVYKFDISAADEDAYEGKFTENTGVEITANDHGRAVMGTIVEQIDGWLYIKFHDMANSYDRIAASGEIKERSNPEYAFKLEALQLLKKDMSPNKYLLSILADRKVKPFTVRKRYTPYDVMEKDGSVHPNVNPSQKEAIEKALNVEDFLLVQGPPGTGKTTIITEMIEDFVRQGLRILICSKNNLAVDNVLEKCQNLYYDEAKTRKMQCLRLGNEEKVLPSVRTALPRPLTQKIQNDVRIQSETARKAYLQREQKIIEQCDEALKDTAVICSLIRFFLKEKDMYISLLEKFTNSKWTFLFGKGRREQFTKELRFLPRKIDILAEQLFSFMKYENLEVQPEEIQQHLQEVRSIYDSMERIEQELERASIRYDLVLGKEKKTVLAECAQTIDGERDIRQKIDTLLAYKGNPAAQAVQTPTYVGEITPTYVDDFQHKVQEQIRTLQSRKKLLRQVLDEWHEELESDQSSLEEPLLRTVHIIGATCIGVNTKNNFKNVEYDVAIVDEAGQITLHDLLVPLVKAKKIILIGDHLQLPPGAETDFCAYVQEQKMLGFEDTDDEEESRQYADELDKVFSVSLFEQLFRDKRFDRNKVMLDTQFRMHPEIAEFISVNFYDGKYKSGVSEAARTLKIAGFTRPMYFVDTCHAKEKYEDTNPDPAVHVNSYEANICASYLAKILVAIENDAYEMPKKNLKDENGAYDIGVITAYKKQIAYIREGLEKQLLKVFDPEKVEHILSHLAINTLDSFQGRDNQIIFYSFVRSNREHKIGFLNEVRRLNVMMTRAKSLLVMVGDSETLTESRSLTIHDQKRASEYYGALVAYCKEKQGYIDYANEG